MGNLDSAAEWPHELYGGWLCIDFANTLDARAMKTTEENLHSYQDLLRWAAAAELVDDTSAALLIRRAASKPVEARAALMAAIDLREAIYRSLYAIATGTAPGREDLDAVQNAYAESMQYARLAADDEDRFSWQWDTPGLHRIRWRVATSAIELLQSGPLDRLKVCASEEGCSGLFLDLSKNRSRRWCSMRTCGIDYKVRQQNSRRRAARKAH